MRRHLLLFFLAVAFTRAATVNIPCTSGLKGDFTYKTCAAFCKAEKGRGHCKYCKCQQCEFCNVSSVPAGDAKRPAKKSHAHNQRSLPVGGTDGYPATATIPPASLATPSSTEEAGREADTTPETPLNSLLAVAACALLLLGCAYSQLASVSAAEAPASLPLRAPASNGSKGGGPDSERDDESLAGRALSLLAAPEGRTRMLCVAFLCLQYSAYALLRRYATGILKEDWSMASVLGAGEAIKFVISLACIGAWDSASEAPAGPLTSRLPYLLAHSGKMAVPAFLCASAGARTIPLVSALSLDGRSAVRVPRMPDLAMNMLGFVSLRRLDAGTFAIIQQSKVFFTALFQRLLLHRTLSVPKWCALVLLVLGVTLISLMAQPGSHGCGPWAAQPWGSDAAQHAPHAAPATAAAAAGLSSYAIGVLAVSADSAMSGFATVYFEKVLKTTVLTVWDRNLQLAFWSILIYLPWALWEHPTSPLHGWSPVTLLLALLGALGGILVALVIKHADGLAKNLSTASSIVLTTAAGHVLFQGPMSTAIIIGSMIVVTAGYTYQKVD